MASIFGHGIVAFTISKVVNSKEISLLILLAIVSSILPDFDVISFKLNIPYLHPLGHRGFTHSILFAVIWAILLGFLFGKARKQIFIIVIFLSTISHGLLDALTTGGKGIGFFIPFDNSRYFFPTRIIQVSPLGIEQFFSEWGMRVILSELKYIAIPCSIILITLFILKKAK